MVEIILGFSSPGRRRICFMLFFLSGYRRRKEADWRRVTFGIILELTIRVFGLNRPKMKMMKIDGDGDGDETGLRPRTIYISILLCLVVSVGGATKVRHSTQLLGAQQRRPIREGGNKRI